MFGVYVFKPSKDKKGTYHIGPIEKEASMDLKSFLKNGVSNQYSLIAIKPSYEEAKAFADSIKQKLGDG